MYQAINERQALEALLPNVVKWKYVKPQMRKLGKKLILGLDPTCRMKPSEETIIEAILDIFNVEPGDVNTRKAFQRSWDDGMRTKVSRLMCNRRDRFTTDARLEMWRLLGHPRPTRGTPEEIAVWKAIMMVYDAVTWRQKGSDSFGLDTFIGAINFVKFGRQHASNTEPIKLLLG